MFYVQVEIGLGIMSPTLESFNMILHCVYSNSVWIECVEFSLKLHKILNLGTLSLKILVAKSDERFSKWRKFLLTKNFVYKKLLVKISQVVKFFALEVLIHVS